MKSKSILARRLLCLLLAAVVSLQFLQVQPPIVEAEAVTLEDFGDGSDGALHIKAGQTVTLPVTVPYQSVVEKNYTSVYIEAGGVLTTSAPNAGLVLRVQGACTINGTIDQSLKGGLPSVYNTFSYPPELRCGAGGDGGAGSGGYYYGGYGVGGIGMPAVKFGGGYGAGGGGGAGAHEGSDGEGSVFPAGKGGDSNTITLSTPIPSLFLGGQPEKEGVYGGGGGASGPIGGTGPGGHGNKYYYEDDGGSGGAGNMGGGVVVIYCGGHCTIGGTILAKGGNGGNGGMGYGGAGRTTSGAGGGGGGGGGGAIYVCYKNTISNTGNFDVSGGNGGSAGTTYTSNPRAASNGSNGGVGSVTIKKLPDSNPPTISGVTVPTAWGQSNTITIYATDDMTGVKDYAVATTNLAPASGWQGSNSFTYSNNGTFYAFARDNMGNVSAGKAFTVNKVDTTAPVIDNVTVTPAGWTGSSTKTITVTATDGQSGIAGYGITTNAIAPSSWQPSNIFNKPAGIYYIWAKDNVGRVSGYRQAVVDSIDIVSPTITGVSLPINWGISNTATINATDSGSGVNIYAVSAISATPMDGWTSDRSFTFTQNGTYYAFCKDKAGNISNPFSFVVDKVDDIKPVVNSVTVPTEWAATNKVKLLASDVGVGIAEYAVAAKEETPTDWQTSPDFILDENGTYYAWAKDKAGNVSAAKAFVVDKVDTFVPGIDSVEISPEWATKSTVTVTASDVGSGIKDYTVTSSDTVPTDGWQASNRFTLTANGTYYAWSRDKVGNVSLGYIFVIDKVDNQKPSVTGVEIPLEWAAENTVKVVASDIGSGVKEYAISSYSFAPSTGWQDTADFILVNNGKYYAFVRDIAGNVSQGKLFEVNKVDTSKPTVTAVNIPIGWSGSLEVTLEATDSDSGVGGYAVTKSTKKPAADQWQADNKFAIGENGTFYAWAKDIVGNISSGRYFNISRVDKTLPEIASIGYNSDYTTIMVRGKDSGSGVKCIYLDGTKFDGATVSLDLPAGARYIKIQVEDNAGNKSPEATERIPGWFDMLDTLTVAPVEFGAGNKTAVITATSSIGSDIVGIYINGKLSTGNPVTYFLPAGMEYLELQAQDKAGDRSEIYRVRVPGWSSEVKTISIVDVRFAEDSSSVQITAMETGGKGIRGIRINGELLPGNPVTYQIPAGTRHLDMQAEDREGDRSAVLIRRVPGWSEVVTTLTVTDVTFTDYNTTAQITATATGGDSVAGIIVNGELLEGNPVIYKVPKGTETLHIQAVNPQGDLSPMLNKAVPLDASKSTLKLYIESPGWTSDRKAKVKLTAEDKNRITKINVRTSDESEWADVTEQRYIYITSNTTVYASVENDKGEIKEVSQDITCFDRTAPKVTATQDGKTINIRATDELSGVKVILVNGKEYQEGDFEDGKLAYRIPEGTTMVTVKAEDAAGNLSRAVELPLQTTVAALPVVIAPTPTPTPEPELTQEDVAVPEPEPLPTPEPIPSQEPAPEPTVTETAAEPEPLPPAAKAAAAAGGLGTTTLGGIWYWVRKKALSQSVEELGLTGKLFYDESEFGGSIDPLDKQKGE
ncbi:MAG: hypothetical protein RSD07_06700 [Angelakisella sp.]